MRYLRLLPLLLAILLAGALSYYVWRLPTIDMPMPSATRMAERIAAIAREPHSVAHTEAREAVRRELVDQIEHLGADPVLLSYPNQEAKGYRFDAVDIFAQWPPLFEDSDSVTWLMLVAHYDSRYPWAPVRDTVSSFGAADDGYGVAVALECIAQAIRHRMSWHQGIRLLLTDAEEVGMVGMKCAWEHNPELFSRVGLLLNIEARGPYGPCLLFETSPGNARLIDFFASQAIAPVGYSITNAVYRMMPNYTDFTIVRDELPGLNFAALADINHYHTDKDCIAAVDTTTLAHYGRQIYPVIESYLSTKRFADPDALRAHHDDFYFSLPLFGLVHCSQGIFLMSNALLIILIVYLIRTSRRPLGKVLRSSASILAAGLAVYVLGELLGYGCALLCGARWKTMGTVAGIAADNVVMAVAVAALAAGIAIMLWRKHDAVQLLYSILAVLMLLSVVLLFAAGDNMPFSFPLLVGGATIAADRLNHSHVFIPLALFAISLQAMTFLYVLAMALTIGALGLVLFIAFFDLMLILTFSKIYWLEQHR